MTQTKWSAVDDYFARWLTPRDEILETVLRNSEEAGLPPINVAPNQGQFLMLLAMSLRAQSILEVGTLGAYSTIWLARALPPGGQVVTLELSPDYAAIARRNLALAGLQDVVEVRVGLALDSLQGLATEARPPFDLIFIDADKENNVAYFEWALKLARPGSLIIVDNVVRDGNILDPHHPDTRVQGVQRFFEHLARQQGVASTAMQTVGSKGYDGFAITLVTGEA